MTIAITILVFLLIAALAAFIHADDTSSKLRGEAESARILANAKIKQVVYWRDNAIKLEKRLIRCNRRIATQNAHTSNLEDDTQRLACELNARESLEDELAEADRQIQDFDARFKRQQETIKDYQSNTTKLNDVADENYRLLGLAEGRVRDLEQENKRLIERTNEAEDNSEDRDEVRIELAVAQSTIKRRNEALAQQEKMVANGRVDARAYQVQRDEWRGKFNALEAAVDPDNLLEAFIENAQQMRDKLKQDN
tara:strand:- start:36993 stop:37751 length:759 start_codon:yes stop_codon:yes gene_type:complete